MDKVSSIDGNAHRQVTASRGFPRKICLGLSMLLLLVLAPLAAWASGNGGPADFTSHWSGWTSLLIFVLAYALVIGEESLHLRKS
ncbi:MAG: hypothetical protein KDI88_15220, partial [Gammaproteobacteria bacterium]|nr:hypothetical protein [Gammaproteobacteria bacterium]